MSAKKGISFIILFLSFQLFAGKLLLKNGKEINVPDVITIHNDLKEIIYIHKYFKDSIDARFQRYEVEIGQAVNVEVNNESNTMFQGMTNCLKIYTKDTKENYSIEYPTYYHPDTMILEKGLNAYTILTSVRKIIKAH